VKIHLCLYTTSFCHLCDQAESILIRLSQRYNLMWDKIDIADDFALLELYEIKIPVIKASNCNIEISWPFSESDIENLIRKSS